MPGATGAGTQAQPKTMPREFTDREEPRRKFWEKYDAMQDGNWEILAFYGEGGIGKTTLIEKLIEEMKEKGKAEGSTGYRCVLCDFSNKDIHPRNLLDVLKRLKTQLEGKGIDFPLYETGAFYAALLRGDKAEKPEPQTFFSKHPALSKIKKALNGLEGKEDMLSNGMNAAISLMEMGDAAARTVAGAVPLISLFRGAFNAAEKVTEFVIAKSKKPDPEYDKIRQEMQKRLEATEHPERMQEYLPTLFARDIEDWVKEHHEKLVVFLNNYDRFGVEDWDLWLRSGKEDNPGIINMIPNVLWVIAGRNKLVWDGVPGAELENPENQRELAPFSPEDADAFLSKAGIASRELRDGIYKLTGGWPLYLDGCVEVYKERGEKTVLSDFGSSREKVFAKIVEGKGMETRDMIRALCALETWTDEMAYEVLKERKFSSEAYEQAKTLSFLREQKIEEEDFSETVFTFHPTVHKILFAQYKEESTSKYFYRDIREEAGRYFAKKLNGIKPDSHAFVFYLENWAACIARLTDDADELIAQYEEHLQPALDRMNWLWRHKVTGDIAEAFLSRSAELKGEDSVAYAFFEHRGGMAKEAWGRYAEAYKYVNSAYQKLMRHLGDGHPYTVTALRDLIETTERIGRKQDAAKLMERSLQIYKKLYGAGDERPLSVMERLAYIYGDLEMREDLLRIQKEELSVYQRQYGEGDGRTLEAMAAVLLLLHTLEHDEEEETFRQKIWDIERAILLDYEQRLKKGDRMAVKEMTEAMDTVCHSLGRDSWSSSSKESGSFVRACSAAHFYDDFSDLLPDDDMRCLRVKLLNEAKAMLDENDEERIAVLERMIVEYSYAWNNDDIIRTRKELVAVLQRTRGETDNSTIDAMRDLVYDLRAANLFEEALAVGKQIVAVLRRKAADCREGEERQIELMEEIARCLDDMEDREEELKVRQEILALRCRTLGEFDKKTMDARTSVTIVLKEFLDGNEEALKLQEAFLSACRESLGETDERTITAMEDVADTLWNMERYDEEIQLKREIMSICLRKYGEDKHETLKAMQELAEALGRADRYEDALEVMKHRMEIIQKTYGDDDWQTLYAIEDVAKFAQAAGRNAEVVALRQRILYLKQEKYGEEAEKTLRALEELRDSFVTLRQYASAVQIQQRIFDLKKKNLGEPQSDTARARHELAYLMCFDGKCEEAITMLREAVELYKAPVSLNILRQTLHVLTLCEALRVLVRYETDWSNDLPEKALGISESSDELTRTIVDLLCEAAGSLQKASCYEGARECLTRALKTSEAVFIEAYEKEDKEECLSLALETSKSIFGEEDKLTAEIASAYDAL